MPNNGRKLVSSPLYFKSVVATENRHLQCGSNVILLSGFGDAIPPVLETRKPHEHPLSCFNQGLTVLLRMPVCDELLKFGIMGSGIGKHCVSGVMAVLSRPPFTLWRRPCHEPPRDRTSTGDEDNQSVRLHRAATQHRASQACNTLRAGVLLSRVT